MRDHHLKWTAYTVDAWLVKESVPHSVHDLQIKLAGIPSPKGDGEIPSYIDGAEGGPLRDLRMEAAGILINGGRFDCFGVADTAGDKSAFPLRSGISAQQNTGEADGHLGGHALECDLRVISGAEETTSSKVPGAVCDHVLKQIADHRDLPPVITAGILQRGDVPAQGTDQSGLLFRRETLDSGTAARRFQALVELLHQFGVGCEPLQPGHALENRIGPEPPLFHPGR